MQASSFIPAALAALVLASGALPARPAAGDEGREIEIRSRPGCEGDDCETAIHPLVRIDEEGLRTLVDGVVLPEIALLHDGRGGGFLGVRMTDLTPELRAHFGVPEDAGVMVSRVVDDSPAARAGVAVGDIISLVDGEPVSSPMGLAAAIGGREEGDAVTLEIWRDGQVIQLTATLEEREGPRAMPHLLHHRGGHPRIQKRVEIRCAPGDERCGDRLEAFDLDARCPSEDCEVRVLCEEDGCECTVDGEAVDCEEVGVRR